MKKIISISLLLVFMCCSSIAGNIVYPWRSTTAIVKSGQSFEVWFNASSGQTVSSIQLKSTYITVNPTISITSGTWEYDPLSKNTYNRKITVAVPSSAPADRYDLVLVTSSGNETSYGGVKVIKDFKANYYVMHWSDGHLYQGGYDTDVLLKRKNLMIDIANIMDAEIVIETGDNMYNVINNPSREVDYFQGKSTIGTKGMSKASAATFLIAGDHCGVNNDWSSDYKADATHFNKYWGLQFHCFKYGNGRFVNLNNAWNVSTGTNLNEHAYQATQAVSWLNGAGAGGNFTATAGHNYDRMHRVIHEQKPLKLVMAGDKHHSGSSNPWSIYGETSTNAKIAHICNSIRDHFEFNIYRIDNANGTFTKPSGSQGRVDVITNISEMNTPANWDPQLKLTFASSNNGTFASNTATINNKFDFTINGAKIRFVVPKGNSYTVTGGTITQEFNGTNHYIVDVATDVNANTIKTVSISSTTVLVTGVSVTPTSASLAIGNTQQLTATVAPSNATNKTVSWSTSNAGVATVNSSGLVTAIAAGTASITVTTQDGAKTASSVITVTVPVTGVSVTPTSANLAIGNTQQLTATVAPSNATNKTLSWSTSNAGVATVNSSGLVTAIAAGTATITVTTQDGAKTASSAITVASSGTSNGMQVLQAEDATLSGAVVATNQTDYYGTGFADYTNATGDYIQWTVNVPTAGTYDLSFRYSLLSGSRPLELRVNGTVRIASMDFPITGSWSVWGKVISSQSLNAGNNTIRLTTIGSNGGNYDELVVTPYIDACDSSTGWSTASANTLSYFTTDKKQGAGCVQMVGSATEEFRKVFSPAYNSNVTLANGSLSFWYYVSDVSKSGTVRVELGSAGVPDVNELSWPLSGLVNGWNKIDLSLSSATQVGTTNLNALNWFRIYSTKSASITTRIDAIQLVQTSILNRAPGVTTSNFDIKSTHNKQLNIYPNPYRNGKLTVQLNGFEGMSNVQVKIVNLMGQVIYQEQLTNTTLTELNLEGKLDPTVYLISVESGDSKVLSKLVVK